MNRRDFLKSLSVATAASLVDLKSVAATGAVTATAPKLPMPTAQKLPRWRGFNLLEKFIAAMQNTRFREQDFSMLAEWGFNFVRLPMSYHCWSSPQNWREIREPVMQEIDEAVEFGRQYGIHVSLNFHRAPGYSVDRSQKEPFNLWSDDEALEACVYHWRHFAARYKNISSDRLSFDLVNEPGFKNDREFIDDATYHRVAKALVDGIRAESPDRLVIADGLSWGRVPVPMLAELGIAQSTRGYEPMDVSHWKAEWIDGSENWPEPVWPLAATPASAESDRRQMAGFKNSFPDNEIMQRLADDPVLVGDWNVDRLKHQLIRPWKELEAMGVGVHVGEFGAHNRTPHPVVLAWLEQLMGLWREAGWGWAMWNFRGTFGPLDSGRADVNYENFRGHKLDRAMLELLREN